MKRRYRFRYVGGFFTTGLILIGFLLVVTIPLALIGLIDSIAVDVEEWE